MSGYSKLIAVARNSFAFVVIGGALLISSCKPTVKTPEEVLSRIPLIDSFRVYDNDTLFKSTYEVWFRMPLDHNNPNSPVFPLRVYYSHLDFGKPMVEVIDGYTMYTHRANEMSRILNSNQLTIEHRFYDRSRPKDSIPWSYLTVRQAAADQHAVINAFKQFYKGKWVSTGISKSGQATIFHRRYYPHDVDVSVPYVAPLNFSSEDPRAYSFLQNVGTDDCRRRIAEYQTQLFKLKDKIYPMFVDLVNESKWDFPMGLSRAYDLSVLEYQFAFWQWGIPCDNIPAKASSPEQLFNHWRMVKPFSFFDAKSTDTRLFLYQAMTEIGMYGYEVEPFKRYLPDTANINFAFAMPAGMKAIYHPETMQDINRWVRDSGNYMLYIYGQNDAWSSTAVEPGSKTNAVKMVNPGGSHSTRIRSFPPAMRDSIYSVLERWLQVDLSNLKSTSNSNPAEPTPQQKKP